MIWKTSRREFRFDRTLVMGILNVTPDSFFDGGSFGDLDAALRRAEELIAEGADIIDIGGESTRPNSTRVAFHEEIRRVVPVIEGIAKRFDVAVSIDTSKNEVARAAVDAGAEIINDVSGLRFDERIGEIAANSGSGLILMHLRGNFETMHSQTPVPDIVADVADGWRASLTIAGRYEVERDRIALDIGIGFGKSVEQNLEIIAKLDKLVREFNDLAVLVGLSRKSFLGTILGGVPVGERLAGSLSGAALAVWNGARIVRVHDVAETAHAVRVVEAIKEQL